MSVCMYVFKRDISVPFLSDSKLTQPLPQYTVHRTLDMVDKDALDIDRVHAWHQAKLLKAHWKAQVGDAKEKEDSVI